MVPNAKIIASHTYGKDKFRFRVGTVASRRLCFNFRGETEIINVVGKIQIEDFRDAGVVGLSFDTSRDYPGSSMQIIDDFSRVYFDSLTMQIFVEERLWSGSVYKVVKFKNPLYITEVYAPEAITREQFDSYVKAARGPHWDFSKTK